MTDTMPTAPMPEDGAPAMPEQGAEAPPMPAEDQGQALMPEGASPEGALPEGMPSEESPAGEPSGGPEQAESESGMPPGAEEDPEVAAHMPIAEVVVGIAHDYMVPMSEESLTEWVHHLVKQKATPEEAEKIFKPYAQQIAEAMYPTFASQIKKGIPVKTLVSPYGEVAKQMLGPGTEPDFSQPHWEKALSGGTHPETGGNAPMDMTEWKKHITKEPSFGYDKTPHGNAKMAQFLASMSSEFSGGKQ